MSSSIQKFKNKSIYLIIEQLYDGLRVKLNVNVSSQVRFIIKANLSEEKKKVMKTDMHF